MTKLAWQAEHCKLKLGRLAPWRHRPVPRCWCRARSSLQSFAGVISRLAVPMTIDDGPRLLLILEGRSLHVGPRCL